MLAAPEGIIALVLHLVPNPMNQDNFSDTLIWSKQLSKTKGYRSRALRSNKPARSVIVLSVSCRHRSLRCRFDDDLYPRFDAMPHLRS